MGGTFTDFGSGPSSESAFDSSRGAVAMPQDSNVPHESLRMPVPRARGAAAPAEPPTKSVAELGQEIEKKEADAKQAAATPAYNAPAAIHLALPPMPDLSLALSGTAGASSNGANASGSDSSTEAKSVDYANMLLSAAKGAGNGGPILGLVSTPLKMDAMAGVGKGPSFGITNTSSGSGGSGGNTNGTGSSSSSGSSTSSGSGGGK